MPIRNCNKEGGTAKHVTYTHENFKHGRCDLLKNIQYSTCGIGAISNDQNQQHEVQSLREQIDDLHKRLQQTTKQCEEHICCLELEMISMQQCQQHMQLQLQTTASVDPNNNLNNSAPNTEGIFASSLHTVLTGLQKRMGFKSSSIFAGKLDTVSDQIGCFCK